MPRTSRPRPLPARRPRTTLAAASVALLVTALAGCGGSDEESAAASPPEKAEESSAEAPSVSDPEITSTGFGRSGEYIQAVAMVQNDADHAGHAITVEVQLLDEAGEVVDRQSQTDRFSWADQTLPVLGWFVLDEATAERVASVEATLEVADTATGEPGEPLEQVEVAEVAPDDYGTFTATLTLPNDGEEPLGKLRVPVVCLDGEDAIAGAGVEFPEEVPVGDGVELTVTVTAADQPASCLAYQAYSSS